MANITNLTELAAFLESFESHNLVQKVIYGSEVELDNYIDSTEITSGQFVIFAEYANPDIQNNTDTYSINFTFGLTFITPSAGPGSETFAGEQTKMDAALALMKDFSAWVMYQRRSGDYPQARLLANDFRNSEPVKYSGPAECIGFRTEISLSHPDHFEYNPASYS